MAFKKRQPQSLFTTPGQGESLHCKHTTSPRGEGDESLAVWPSPAPNLLKPSWSITYSTDLHDRQAHTGPSECLVMSSQAHRPFCLTKLTLSGL